MRHMDEKEMCKTTDPLVRCPGDTIGNLARNSLAKCLSFSVVHTDKIQQVGPYLLIGWSKWIRNETPLHILAYL